MNIGILWFFDMVGQFNCNNRISRTHMIAVLIRMRSMGFTVFLRSLVAKQVIAELMQTQIKFQLIFRNAHSRMVGSSGNCLPKVMTSNNHAS